MGLSHSLTPQIARSVHLGHLLPKHIHLLLVTVVWQLEEDFITRLGLGVTEVKVAITSDPSGELHVLLLDGQALRVDRAEVGVLEEADDVGLGGFL